MRTHQYRCRTCGRHFEMTISDSECEQVPECPYCQGQDIELRLSALFAPKEKLATAASQPSASNCGSPGTFR